MITIIIPEWVMLMIGIWIGAKALVEILDFIMRYYQRKLDKLEREQHLKEKP